jgi:hypothetical protein
MRTWKENSRLLFRVTELPKKSVHLRLVAAPGSKAAEQELIPLQAGSGDGVDGA